MAKSRQRQIQTALVILSLATLSFMVGYWHGLVPYASKLQTDGRKVVEKSNTRDLKSNHWKDENVRSERKQATRSNLPGHKVSKYGKVIPVRKKKRPLSIGQKAHLKHHPPAYQFPASIFDFKSMTLPQSSPNHPFTFAKTLMKTEISWEYINNSDVKNALMPRTKEEAPSVEGMEKSLAEKGVNFNRILPDKSVSYHLGEEIPPTHAKKILIVTTWRSGSTFLGDLLNHYPGTWYSFEPLHYKNPDTTSDVDFATKLVSDIFKCQPERGYYKHANEANNRFLFKHNFRFWNTCDNLLMGSAACFMPLLSEQSCPLFPIRTIKVVRMRMKHAKMLFDDPEVGKGLQIVFLVRDPRGVMNSRDTMDWCSKSSCNNPRVLCDNMQEDLIHALDIKQRFPGKIHLVRYEDLCLQPFQQTDQLLEFLNLPKRPVIEKYLEESTSSKRLEEEQEVAASQLEQKRSRKLKQNPYSTKRNSKVTVFAWRQKIKPDEVEEIQNSCSKPMEDLGYNLFRDIDRDLHDDQFSVLQPKRVFN